MSARKKGRKKRAAWRKYRRQLLVLAKMQQAMVIAQNAASMALIYSQGSKCGRCLHTFEESKGEIVLPVKAGEQVLTPAQQKKILGAVNACNQEGGK